MLLDIAPTEFLLIAAVAIVAIGPKDLPRALRIAGRWMGRMRRASNHLRSGFEAIIREAELEEMERSWRERNEEIMKAHPLAPGDPVLPAETMALPAPEAAQDDLAGAAPTISETPSSPGAPSRAEPKA